MRVPGTARHPTSPAALLPSRRYAVPEPYEKLKAFTRGQAVTQASMQVRRAAWHLARAAPAAAGVSRRWGMFAWVNAGLLAPLASLTLHLPRLTRSPPSCLRPLTQEFVSGIDGIPPAAQAELLALTPATYIGNAAQQAKDIRARLAAL